MNRTTWLHLSDVHYEHQNFDTEYMREELIKKISTISKNIKISFIVITGDLSYKGIINDKELSDFLEGIREACGIEKNKIFIVPGNHDIKRTIPRKDAIDAIIGKPHTEKNIDERITTLTDGFKDFFDFYKSYFGKDYPNKNNEATWIEKVNDINIIGINTAICCCQDGEDGKLALHRVGLKNKIKELDKLDHLNIAIGHHGFDCLESRDKSKTTHIFNDNLVSLYLCGHTHTPNVTTSADGNYDLSTITCGPAIVDDITTGYFVVETYDRTRNQIEATFYKWENSQDFWVKDTASNRKADENGKIVIPNILNKEQNNETYLDSDAFQGFLVSFNDNFESSDDNSSKQLYQKDIHEKFSKMNCNNAMKKHYEQLSIYFPIIEELHDTGLITDKNLLKIQSAIIGAYNSNFDKFDNGNQIFENMIEQLFCSYKDKISYTDDTLKLYIRILIYWFIYECDIFDDSKEN